MVLGGPFCSLCFSLMHFIFPLTRVIRCGQEGKKDRRPSLLLGEYTDLLGGFSWRKHVGQVSLEMCLAASCVRGKRSLVMVCMHYLSVTRAGSAGAGLGARPDVPCRSRLPLGTLVLPRGPSLCCFSWGSPWLLWTLGCRLSGEPTPVWMSVLVLTTSPGSEIPEVTVICVFCSAVSTGRETQQVRWGLTACYEAEPWPKCCPDAPPESLTSLEQKPLGSATYKMCFHAPISSSLLGSCLVVSVSLCLDDQAL